VPLLEDGTKRLDRWPANANDGPKLCKDVVDYCMTQGKRGRQDRGRPRVRADSVLTGTKEEGFSCDMQAKTIENGFCGQ